MNDRERIIKEKMFKVVSDWDNNGTEYASRIRLVDYLFALFPQPLQPLDEEAVAEFLWKYSKANSMEWGEEEKYFYDFANDLCQKFGRPSIKLPERATCVCEDRLSFDRCTCGAERINDLLDEIRKLNGMDKIAELNNLGGKGE